MKLSEIAEILNGKLESPQDIEISGPAKIEEALPGQISFLSNPKYKHFLETTKASAIVVDKNTREIKIPHIRVDDAYVGFLILLKIFSPNRTDAFSGISDKAFIAESARVDPDCRIAPLVYIGNNVKIGKECVIYPGVVILDNVVIGDKCVLYPNVSIREDCILGNNIIIHNSAVIGSDGFGFAPKDGVYIKIPQIGNVILEDNIEIGANTTIDRATVGSTRIKSGTKLDNLIQVAHNCVIGENTVIAAQTGMAGSTEIGNNVTIGGQVGIAGHLKVGDKSILAAQSGISKDTGDAAILMGTPAVQIMHRKRIDVCLRHLPENTKKISQLETEIEKLKEQMKKHIKESTK